MWALFYKKEYLWDQVLLGVLVPYVAQKSFQYFPRPSQSLVNTLTQSLVNTLLSFL